MRRELSSSYHARGKGLPATVGHMPPSSQSEAVLKFWKMGVPERFGSRYVTVDGVSIWRERVFHVDYIKLETRHQYGMMKEAAGHEKTKDQNGL